MHVVFISPLRDDKQINRSLFVHRQCEQIVSSISKLINFLLIIELVKSYLIHIGVHSMSQNSKVSSVSAPVLKLPTGVRINFSFYIYQMHCQKIYKND